MTAARLQNLINEHAMQGWERDRIVAGEVALLSVPQFSSATGPLLGDETDLDLFIDGLRLIVGGSR